MAQEVVCFEASVVKFLSVAKRAFAQGENDQARKIARLVVCAAPGNWSAITLIGHVYLRRGVKSFAIPYFAWAARAAGDQDARAWTNLGNILSLNNLSKDALLAYKKAATLDTDSILARTQIALLLLTGPNPRLSAPWLKELAAVKKFPSHMALQLGDALLNYRAYRDSLLFYEKALFGDSCSVAMGLHGIGLSHFNRREWSAAISSLRRALLIQPDNKSHNESWVRALLKVRVSSYDQWLPRIICLFVPDISLCSVLVEKILSIRKPQYAHAYSCVLINKFPYNRKIVSQHIKILDQLRIRSDLLLLASKIFYDVRVGSLLFDQTICDELLRALVKDEKCDEYKIYAAIVLKTHPDQEIFYLNHGLFLFNRENLKEAALFFRQAVTLRPNYLKAWYQLSICSGAEQAYKRAEIELTRALAVNPNHSLSWLNRGLLAQSDQKVMLAIEYIREAIRRSKGQFPEGEYNLALHLLALGNIKEGYKLYRSRWQAVAFSSEARQFPYPEWPGPKLAPASNLLVYMEQGMGDEVMYSWLFPYLMCDCQTVTVECDDRLVSIFKRTFPGIKFFARGSGANQDLRTDTIDYQIAVAQLPEHYSKIVDDFIIKTDADGPYVGRRSPARLKTSAERYLFWRDLMKSKYPGRIIVGVAWRSGRRDRIRDAQYLEIHELAEALIPGCVAVNLQYDYSTDELTDLKAAGLRAGFEVFTPPGLDLKNDLDDLFALIETLDVVVSPLISVPWLASAVGTPSLVFRTNENNRIWLQFGRPYVPWGPGIKLYFRRRGNNWDSAIQAVRKDLRAFSNSAIT